MKTSPQTLAFVTLLSFCLLWIGCKKEEVETEIEETEEVEETVTVLTLDLLNPVESIEPSYCCIEFQWTSNDSSQARLQLADNADFNDLVLDTLLTTQSFFFDQPLAPNTQYYWAVQTDSLSSTAAFVTEDLLSAYEGVHEFEYWRSSWIKEQPSTSDTFYTTMELVVEDDFITIFGDSAGVNWKHYFHAYENENQLVYYTYNGPGYNGAALIIDMETDSIFGEGSGGGLGGGSSWWFRGKKE